MDNQQPLPTADGQADMHDLAYYEGQYKNRVSSISVIVDSFFMFTDSTHSEAVEALTQILQHWIETEYVRLAGTLKAEDLHYHTNYIRSTLAVIRLLADLSDSIALVDFYAGKIKQIEKGGLAQ